MSVPALLRDVSPEALEKSVMPTLLKPWPEGCRAAFKTLLGTEAGPSQSLATPSRRKHMRTESLPLLQEDQYVVCKTCRRPVLLEVFDDHVRVCSSLPPPRAASPGDELRAGSPSAKLQTHRAKSPVPQAPRPPSAGAVGSRPSSAAVGAAGAGGGRPPKMPKRGTPPNAAQATAGAKGAELRRLQFARGEITVDEVCGVANGDKVCNSRRRCCHAPCAPRSRLPTVPLTATRPRTPGLSAQAQLQVPQPDAEEDGRRAVAAIRPASRGVQLKGARRRPPACRPGVLGRRDPACKKVSCAVHPLSIGHRARVGNRARPGPGVTRSCLSRSGGGSYAHGSTAAHGLPSHSVGGRGALLAAQMAAQAAAAPPPPPPDPAWVAEWQQMLRAMPSLEEAARSCAEYREFRPNSSQQPCRCQPPTSVSNACACLSPRRLGCAGICPRLWYALQNNPVSLAAGLCISPSQAANAIACGASRPPSSSTAIRSRPRKPRRAAPSAALLTSPGPQRATASAVCGLADPPAHCPRAQKPKAPKGGADAGTASAAAAAGNGNWQGTNSPTAAGLQSPGGAAMAPLRPSQPLRPASTIF